MNLDLVGEGQLQPAPTMPDLAVSTLSLANPASVTTTLPDDPKADVVLRCREDDFPFRKAHLISASEVFEDLLVNAEAGEQQADGKPVIPLDEEGDVGAFLLHLHPRAASPEVKTLAQLQSLCRLADKYACISLLHALLDLAAPALPDAHPPSLLALAVQYRDARLAAHALRAFDPPTDHGPTVRRVDLMGQFTFTPPAFTLADVPADVYEKAVCAEPAVYGQLWRCQLAIFDPAHRLSGWAALAEALKSNPLLLDGDGLHLAAWLEVMRR